MDTIHIEKRTFPVLDMSCAACAARVDKTLNGQPGVRMASVNYAAATATVEYDTAQCSPEQLKAALQAAGYDLLVGDDRKQLEDRAEQAHDEKYRRLRQRTVWAIILALPVAVIGMFFMHTPYADLISWALATPVVLWLGRDFHRNAWRQLRHGTANMDTLVSNSTLIAYVFSLFNMLFPEFWTARGVEPHVYFEAASVIIAFILLGRLLEERAKGNTSTAIRKLMGLQPRTVTIVDDRGETREISIDDLQRGQTVSVRPGERIAVDGTIVAGSSYIDESMLSGEPVPVAKREGSHVFAGTINQRGSFRFRAEKVGADTVLAHIIRMVQDAQGSKAPVQRLVDRIAAIFVPVIIGIAFLSFSLWWTLAPSDGFTHGLLALVTVLIIACPCALGLATPTSIMTGSGRAAELGVLFRGGEQLETAYKTDTVVFDKTGTLTLGLTDGAEQLRPGAAETVRALRDRGMELWMISGDKREKAERIAGMLGIENVLCEVRPADKSDAVKALQARAKHVCFIGDGINDSPALACADIGVALGCGADIAISTADVMIVSSSMQSVQTVFDISAATMKNVRQNLIWAAVYNVICIPLAASGIINPSIAAAAMALSSNGVLLNALRLKKYEP